MLKMKTLKSLKPEICYEGQVDGTEFEQVKLQDTIGPKVKQKKLKDLKPELWKSEKQGVGENRLD